jgi:ABC-type multidrug transport system fused ATPase/permease subunit
MMKVDVVRFGNVQRRASVHYTTKDGSATAGVKYVSCSGLLAFEPGETLQTIEVPIIDDRSWNATLEFELILSNARGASLGKYLDSCRVKVIDTDYFPTNTYKEQFEEQNATKGELEVPGMGLFLEFLKLCFADRDIFLKAVSYCALDLIKGLYYFLTLWLQMYLIDVVLSGGEEEEEVDVPEVPEEGEHSAGEEAPRRLLQAIRAAARALGRSLGEEDGRSLGEEEASPQFMLHGLLIPNQRRSTALVVAALYFLPFALVHLSDFVKCYISLEGRVRKLLQANLMRKFFNYKEEFRNAISSSDLTMAMVRDAKEVVDFGFMKLFNVFRISGKLMFALLFVLNETPFGAIPIIVCPIVLGIFLWCREKKLTEAAEERHKKQNEVVRVVADGVKNYRLIADFYMRSTIQDKYEQKIDEFVEHESHMLAVITNNRYLSPWLTTFSIGVLIVVGSCEVRSDKSGALSLGMFVTMLNIFKELGKEIEEIYIDCIEIQKCFGAIQKISVYMNMPVDVIDRMRTNRLRRSTGRRQQLKARSSVHDNLEDLEKVQFPVDTIRIQADHLGFTYSGAAHPILDDVTVEWEQGRLYAFFGPPHQGKATLMKLLGQVLTQEGEDTKGSIFVPPHLRICHVSQETLIMRGSFLDNLIMNTSLERCGGLERVRSICKELRFPKALVDLLDSPEPADSEVNANTWEAQVSHTGYARLALARVFVMNPEVVVMHKPLAAFDEEKETPLILKLLRRYVEQRGLILPEEDREYRRPRTVFITCSSKAQAKDAHAWYHVSTRWGVRKVGFEEWDDLDEPESSVPSNGNGG